MAVMQQRHARRKGFALTIASAIAGMFLLVIMAVIGLGLFGYSLFKEQIQAELNQNPVILEQLGTIDSLDTDFIASGEDDNENVFVFDVIGERGQGVVTVESITIDADREEIVWGELTLPSGETLQIAPLDE